MNALRPDTGAVRDHIDWLALLEYGCIEVRAIAANRSEPTLIGYFDRVGALLDAVHALSSSDASRIIYIGTQPRPMRLFERSRNELRAGIRGANAADIETLAALYIDIDPMRPEGAEQQAATDREVATALEAADRASDYMASEGFLRPVIVMSGNGAQLWCRLPATRLDRDDRDPLELGLKLWEAEVREFIKGLGLPVKVDRTSDFARVAKLCGTVSRKGDGLGDRPHRQSTWHRLDCLPGDNSPRWPEPDDRLLRHVLDLGTAELRRLDDQQRIARERVKQRESSNPRIGALSVVERCGRYIGTCAPAIQGNNGSGAILRVARIVFHGFALSEAEGWPLLCDWNRRHASPPFDESEHAKPADSLRRKMLEALRTPLPEALGWTEFGELRDRPLPARAGNGASSSTLNGFDQRSKHQTQPAANESEARKAASLRPIVYLKAHPKDPYRELHAVVADAARVLGERADVFERDGKMVDVGMIDISLGRDPNDRKQRRIWKAMGIRELPASEVQRQLSIAAEWRTFRFLRAQNDHIEVPADPPPWLANSVVNMGHWEHARPLVGILDAPSMRLDGSLIQVPGWDKVTRYLYAPSAEYPIVPEAPTLDDARWALAKLREVFAPQTSERAGFPFATEADGLVPTAALMTMLVRPAIDGPTPAFVFDASTPGTGKTLLADLVCLVGIGSEMPKATFPESSDELEKMLAGLAMAGARVAGFDNLDQRIPFRGAPLDKVLTSTLPQLRVLGSNEMPTHTWCAVLLATGNNVQVLGDTIRRSIRCRLEPDCERPEERAGFAIADIRQYVREHRGELVAAALTVIRAYQAAGCPAVGGKPYGSYERWQAVVVNALTWASGIDVLACRCDVSDGDDPELEAAATLVGALRELGKPASAGELVAAAYDLATTHLGEPIPGSERSPALREALDVLVSAKRGRDGRPTPRAVGAALKRLRGRVFAGFRLLSRPSGKGGNNAEWFVEPATGQAAAPPDDPVHSSVPCVDPAAPCASGRGE